MADTIDILKGISLAMSKAYDGALDEDGEPIKIGLRREEGEPWKDNRLMDGFGVVIKKDILQVNYTSEERLANLHKKDYKGEIESRVQDAVSFLKKEYRKIMKKELSLEQVGELEIFVETISNIRQQVRAQGKYRIAGIEEVKNAGKDEYREKFIKTIEKYNDKN